MIHRFWARGYKSLADIEVALAPLTVVFGPNAAGKSNLLDAIALLARMVSNENLESAFDDHRGSPLEAFSFGPGGAAALLDQDTASFTLGVDVELSPAVVADVQHQIGAYRAAKATGDGKPRPAPLVPRLRYELTVEIATASGHLRVTAERLEALKADGTPVVGRKPFIEAQPDNRTVLVRRDDGQGHPANEELGQDRPIASKRLFPPHHRHVFALRHELSRWRTYFLEPAVMRSDRPLKEVPTLDSRGADLAPFYNTLEAVDPRRFEAFERNLRVAVPGITGIRVGPDDRGMVRLEIDEGGVAMTARIVSEGTLRVLGLLAITNPVIPLSVVGYEEPENGVHPDRLTMVARLLAEAAVRGETQFVINTHSPVLPEYLLDEPEAWLVRCAKREGRTSFERFDETPSLLSGAGISAGLADDPSPFSIRLVRGDFR